MRKPCALRALTSPPPPALTPDMLGQLWRRFFLKLRHYDNSPFKAMEEESQHLFDLAPLAQFLYREARRHVHGWMACNSTAVRPPRKKIKNFLCQNGVEIV